MGDGEGCYSRGSETCFAGLMEMGYERTRHRSLSFLMTFIGWFIISGLVPGGAGTGTALLAPGAPGLV